MLHDCANTGSTQDVRDFVLHLFNEEKAQPWLYVKVRPDLTLLRLHDLTLRGPQNRSSIQKVVAVMLPGLTTESFGVPPPPGRPTMPFEMRAADGRASELPIMQQLFSHACPTQAPGDKLKMHSCYQHFVSCPLTAGEKARRHEARKERGQRQKTNDAKVYLTGREDMLEHGYPMPERDQSVAVEGNAFESWIRADEWIETPVKLPSTDLMKVLAIDCEMVSPRGGGRCVHGTDTGISASQRRAISSLGSASSISKGRTSLMRS